MNDLHRYQQGIGAEFIESFPKIAHFGDAVREFRAAKERCALFDLTGLGILQVTGKDARDLLHRMTMNEMRHMQTGEVLVNALTNAKGKLVDAFFQIKREEGYQLITSHGQSEAVAAWLDRYIFVEKVTCEDFTDGFALFVLTGKSASHIAGIAEQQAPLSETNIAGTTVECLPVASLCPQGILLIVEKQNALPVYKALAEEKQCMPAGAHCFDMLRVEQGVPLFGHEFAAEDTNPYEAGLSEFVDYEKGCYVGQEVIARLDTYDKVKYEYSTLAMRGPALATVPAPILDGDKKVGVLTTSVPDHQNDGHSFALARIRRKALQEKNVFTVSSGEKSFEAKVLSSTLTGASAS